jgi:hypothetical protein
MSAGRIAAGSAEPASIAAIDVAAIKFSMMVRLDGAFANLVYKSVVLTLTDSQEQFLGFELTGSEQVHEVHRVH